MLNTERDEVMSSEFEGRVVLLAGASGGIGVATARTLLQRGARVALHYRSRLETVGEIAAAHGDRALLVKADLTQPAQVEAMVRETTERFGKLDAFVSTVGTALRIKLFLDTPQDAVDRTIDIELRSVISCTRAVLPALIANGGGRIVLVGSDSGKVGTSGESVSAACRGAIIAFAKSISREYARSNVQMNVVCPGPTETQLWEDLVTNDDFGSKIGTAMIRAIPMRRLGKPEEVAAAVAFLASQQASYITGQALSVSGGLTMA
jgi:2-hydroxycyclohexanecarboxyl-CoA dehydrogenase